jgi:type I restriction enzyme R subunit
LQKSKPEIIQTELKKKHLGLLKTRKALQRIIAGLAQIINTFDWE